MPPLGNPVAAAFDLTGVTVAQYPAFAGTVVHDKLDPMDLSAVSEGRSPGQVCQLQSRIVRSAHTGLLDFHYRITGVGPSPSYLQQAIIYRLGQVKGLVLTFADYRLDGLGTLAPTEFRNQLPANGDTSLANRTYAFNFNHAIAQGVGTRFFFISTNAKNFTENSLLFVFSTGNAQLPGLELFVAGPAAP